MATCFGGPLKRSVRFLSLAEARGAHCTGVEGCS